MSADYETDTLTTARSNRAASHRYYQIIPSRSLLSTAVDAPGMLHRSPSGAKRRIKQKREGMGKASPFLPPPSPSNSTSPIPDENTASYRSLMDSGALQSIMPEMPCEFAPQPAPRIHSTLSASTSALDATHTAVPAHSKPTVEVHPMPIDEPKREKPPVPLKPKGLLVDHLNRSTSLTSLASPNSINSTTSAFLSNLVPSPSLLSLERAYKNPDLGSQELRNLDTRRIECISNVSHRLSTFEEKRLSIEEQTAQNERLRQIILEAVQLHDPLLAGKIRRHLENSWDLLRLETKLRLQLDKLVECLKTGAGDKSEAAFEESRLRRRLGDVGLLRTTFQRREMDIEKSLARFLNQEDIRFWQTYIDRAARLIRDERTVDGRIEDSRIHLRALHNTRQST